MLILPIPHKFLSQAKSQCATTLYPFIFSEVIIERPRLLLARRRVRSAKGLAFTTS